MIKTTEEMRQALRRGLWSGIILYQGPSMIDGAPIVAIATRFETRKSNNVKTGDMVQTFIIRSDVHPLDAIKRGLDSSVCGDCLARPANAGFCYVQVGKSVASVYGAFLRGRYAAPGVDYDPAILADLFAGSIFRLGAYGDPGAAPFAIWEHATRLVKARNGYTHQWRRFPEFKAVCMASCDDESDHAEAKAQGWRTFRVRLAYEPLARREIACPASAESGHKTTCSACQACGGLQAKAKADIAIIAHGPTARRFELFRNGERVTA
jgi:hypothetical protein